MSSIDDVRVLLKQQEITYPDLLKVLIQLEREHAVLRLKMVVGLSAQPLEDNKIATKTERLANRITTKILKKLNE